MGWWTIDSVEKGQLDCTHKCSTNPALVNATPGSEDTDNLLNGDGPADAMDKALKKIVAEYQSAWQRSPKMRELLACFNFCANGLQRRMNLVN